jgi:serine/threonine-protein kinase
MWLGYVLWAAAVLLAVGVAGWLALRNLRVGRGDAQGARRLAAVFAVATLIAQLLHGAPLLSWVALSVKAPALAQALLLGGVVWVLYLAVEPYVRHRWPRTLVGWSRLVGGRWRDPLVGRDVLLGVLVAGVVGVLLSLIRLPAFGSIMAPLAPFVPNGLALGSPAELVAAIIEHAMEAVATGLGILVAIVVLRALTRREWLAVALTLLAMVLPHAILGFHDPLPFLLVHLPIFYLPTRLLLRSGLLAFIAFYFSFSLFVNLIGSCDWSSWVGRAGLLPLGVLVALVLWGFWQALGVRIGRSRVAPETAQ